tara:strand:- start:31 stop:561 length:531 start_codon:yes stop_codon:yes gene_type:complete
MTDRKINWNAWSPMTESEKKAASQQQYASTILIVMTFVNIVFGVLMITKILPVYLGMVLAFCAMFVIFLIAKKRLIDKDESLWETPMEFHQRMNRKIMHQWTRTCFITNKNISPDDDTARFTHEFDAWVSEEGQKIVEDDARGTDPSPENEIIFREWYAKDEADAANDEWRAYHNM